MTPAPQESLRSCPGGCENQDPDFNRDGNVDQEDVAALINDVAGATCP